jgi:hypothetical protein
MYSTVEATENEGSECMKVTPRRRMTVTSSLNEITTDQLGNRLILRWEALLRKHAGF